MKNMASIQRHNTILSYISSSIARHHTTTNARRESNPKKATSEVQYIFDPVSSLCLLHTRQTGRPCSVSVLCLNTVIWSMA